MRLLLGFFRALNPDAERIWARIALENHRYGFTFGTMLL